MLKHDSVFIRFDGDAPKFAMVVNHKEIKPPGVIFSTATCHPSAEPSGK
jgi:hypothetical protein